MGHQQMDSARVIFLANERRRQEKKTRAKTHKKTGAATKPVITGLMRLEAAARARGDPPDD